MKVVLVGYMASGKSTIGRLLAQKLEIPFIDLDDYIAEAEQNSIAELFKNKGEIYFRKKEADYLQEILEKSDSFLLSTGGGTPCYGQNMDAIKEKGITSVYLKSSINSIKERIVNARQKRPLIAHLQEHELSEFIGKHLFERQFFYNQATFVITTDGKSKNEIVNEVMKILH